MHRPLSQVVPSEDRPLPHEIVQYVLPVLATYRNHDLAFDATLPMTRQEAADALGAAFCASIAQDRVRLVQRKEFENGSGLYDRRRYRTLFADEVERRFGAVLMASLRSTGYRKMRKAFGLDGLTDDDVEHSSHRFRLPFEVLRAILFHLYGFAFAGDRERTFALVPLTGLLVKAIPIGITHGDSAWTVVVADGVI